MVRLRRRTLGFAALGLGFLAILAVVSVALGLRQAPRELAIAQLQAENRHLTASLEALREQTGALGQAVDGFAAREERFRLAAGLPLHDPEVQAVGVGGPVTDDGGREEFFRLRPDLAQETYATRYDLDRLLRRAELLTVGLAEAMDSVEARREVFLARPSIWPVATEDAWLSSGFSRSRLHPLLLSRRPHMGLDVSAQSGAPVVATAQGIVMKVGREDGAGRVIEVDHGFGFVTRYAHLSETKVRTGQRVGRGDVIGTVGKTGLATAPHLHYEVHVNDRPVNPRRYLLERHNLPAD